MKLREIPDKVLARFGRDAKPEGEWAVKVGAADLQAYRERNGSRAVKTALSKLGRYRPYYSILTSEIGQMLMRDSLDQCNGLLLKIVNGKATAEDKAEYRAYRRMIDRQLERIHSYIVMTEKVKGG